MRPFTLFSLKNFDTKQDGVTEAIFLSICHLSIYLSIHPSIQFSSGPVAFRHSCRFIAYYFFGDITIEFSPFCRLTRLKIIKGRESCPLKILILKNSGLRKCWYTFMIICCYSAFLCFMPVRPIQIVPPAGVQLPQIQFVINWMSSEGKLSHLVRCDTILLHYYNVSLLII
jgi:hypothetical protein